MTSLVRHYRCVLLWKVTYRYNKSVLTASLAIHGNSAFLPTDIKQIDTNDRCIPALIVCSDRCADVNKNLKLDWKKDGKRRQEIDYHLHTIGELTLRSTYWK